MKIEKLGLTACQLKQIALIFMTIDHLSLLAEEMPVIASYATLLRLLGRIAAPLFLFVLTESIRHTRSKVRLILRLYIAGALTGVFTMITNAFFQNILIYSPGNIFFTYFYVAVYIFLIENIITAKNEQNIRKIIVFAIGIIFTLIPQLLHWWFDALTLPSVEPSWKILFREILNSIAPPVLYIEYSLLFVFMGILIYFGREQKLQCMVFLCFCAVSFIGAYMERDLWPFNDFFERTQYWMVLALPMMLLYNGKRGKQQKVVFYVYYPVHRYLIALLAAMI